MVVECVRALAEHANSRLLVVTEEGAAVRVFACLFPLLRLSFLPAGIALQKLSARKLP